MASPLLPGYTRLKNRAYTTPTGETIGRREYDRRSGRFDRASESLGERVTSNESLRAAREESAGEEYYASNAAYQEYVREFRWFQRHEGNDYSAREAATVIKERGLYAKLRSGNRSANGPMHQALEAIGRRRRGADYRVGDTPVFIQSPIREFGYDGPPSKLFR